MPYANPESRRKFMREYMRDRRANEKEEKRSAQRATLNRAAVDASPGDHAGAGSGDDNGQVGKVYFNKVVPVPVRVCEICGDGPRAFSFLIALGQEEIKKTLTFNQAEQRWECSRCGVYTYLMS